MRDFVQQIKQHRTEDGASAVEYGLLVAAIAALIVIIVFALGGIVNDVFKGTCDEVASQATANSLSVGSC